MARQGLPLSFPLLERLYVSLLQQAKSNRWAGWMTGHICTSERTQWNTQKEKWPLKSISFLNGLLFSSSSAPFYIFCVGDTSSFKEETKTKKQQSAPCDLSSFGASVREPQRVPHTHTQGSQKSTFKCWPHAQSPAWTTPALVSPDRYTHTRKREKNKKQTSQTAIEAATFKYKLPPPPFPPHTLK